MQVSSVLKFVSTANNKKREKCELQMTNVHVKEELFLHKTKVIQAEVVPQKFLVDFWYIKYIKKSSRVVHKWKIQKYCHYFCFYEFGKTRAW